MKVAVEYVDIGAHGEYGFFGKLVATSDVRGKSDAEIGREIDEMLTILGADIGNHISVRVIEEV